MPERRITNASCVLRGKKTLPRSAAIPSLSARFSHCFRKWKSLPPIWSSLPAFNLAPWPQGACRGTARSRFRSPAPRPHGARGQRRHRMYPSRRAAQRPGHGVPERAQSGRCPPALGRGRAYPLPGRRTGFRLQQVHPRQGGARRRRSVQPVPDAVPDGDAARRASKLSARAASSLWTWLRSVISCRCSARA